MKLLIIGGTGNISTGITKMMQGKGHDITLFNNDTRRPDWLLQEVNVVCGNRNELDKYEAGLFASGSYDCVMDMICFEPKDAAIDISLFKNRTKQFIFCSTVDVYPKTGSGYPINEDTVIGALPSFPYAYKKVECEKLLWEAHRKKYFSLTVIRPAATYNESWSPGVHTFGGQTYHLHRLLHGKPFILHGDGNSIWTAAHRDDTAKAFTGAAGNEKAYGQAYNANGDEMYTMKKMWRTIAIILNAPEPDFIYIPTNLLYKMAPAESEWCRENFMHNNIFDNSKAKSDLGFKYTIPFEKGAKMSCDYLILHNLVEDSGNYPFYEAIIEQWRSLQESLHKIN